ncbi:MAG: alpha/beta fold hydrolase [Acidimicrobiales bacterium]
MSDVLGHELHGTGPRGVVVLHDWMGDAGEWHQVKPYLDGDDFTYAMADVRGYGRSRALTGDYSAAEIAADIVALSDHLGWSRFDIVGHSMTGMAVQRALVDDAGRAEPRIGKAVAVTPVGANGYPADDQTKQFLLAAVDDAELAVQAFTMLTGGKLGPSWARQRTERFNASTDKAAAKGYYSMWLESDFSAEVVAARPTTPLLVVGGRNDLPGFDEATFDATIGEWFPNVTFAYITDAGHYPMQETPIRLATLIEEHLSDR